MSKRYKVKTQTYNNLFNIQYGKGAKLNDEISKLTVENSNIIMDQNKEKFLLPYKTDGKDITNDLMLQKIWVENDLQINVNSNKVSTNIDTKNRWSVYKDQGTNYLRYLYQNELEDKDSIGSKIENLMNEGVLLLLNKIDDNFTNLNPTVKTLYKIFKQDTSGNKIFDKKDPIDYKTFFESILKDEYKSSCRGIIGASSCEVFIFIPIEKLIDDFNIRLGKPKYQIKQIEYDNFFSSSKKGIKKINLPENKNTTLLQMHGNELPTNIISNTGINYHIIIKKKY